MRKIKRNLPICRLSNPPATDLEINPTLAACIAKKDSDKSMMCNVRNAKKQQKTLHSSFPPLPPRVCLFHGQVHHLSQDRGDQEHAKSSVAALHYPGSGAVQR